MPDRRGVASLSLVPLLLVVLVMAFGAPAATADTLDNVTGGESALFVKLEDVGNLARKGIYVSPISPAYATFTLDEGPAVRFPINGGLVEPSTLLGTVNHSGGLRLQKVNPADNTVEATLDVTDLKIVAGSQLVGNAQGLIPTPTADLANATHSQDPATGVITYEADATLNVITATVLNTYFSTDAFSSGQVLGHLKSTIQTTPAL
jgi:hypothetical protein